jgi:hypothetical protein
LTRLIKIYNKMNFTTLLALLGMINAKSLYDANRSDVSIYTKLNFEKQV